MPSPSMGHELICRLPVGDQGIHYADEDTPEMPAWGPTAFTVGPEGHFWVADTAAARLLRYNRACKLVATLELDEVVGIGDVEVSRSAIFVLDIAAVEPAVFVYDLNGARRARYPLGRDLVPTGLALDDRGVPLVEREFGARLSQLKMDGEEAELVPVEGYLFQGRRFSVQPGDLMAAAPARGLIRADARNVEVQTAQSLGGL